MEGDMDFLQQLFRENNELRFKYNAIQRELYNKTVQTEQAEEEIRQLKQRAAETADRSTGLAIKPQTKDPPKKAKGGHGENAGAGNGNTSKELQEALFLLERRTSEIKLLRDELSLLQSKFEEMKATNEVTDRELSDCKSELNELRLYKGHAARELEAALKRAEFVVPDDVQELKAQIAVKDSTITQLRKQAIDISLDSNRKYNEQQNQLQGVESLIDGIRKEYDEFIQVTKLETESFRKQQESEHRELKEQLEFTKISQFEEKRKLMTEYAGLLYSMQAQFEEYRITAEYMFNMEMEKLEDELSMQAMRYEHEIMYILQAKDKFYADMMISKDAKIMNLIEGSDLQTLIQKHELDMENLRKEHAREIERVKSDQESEQKNLVALLQRQNVSLESKCEKLQAHLKTLEIKIRELMGTIDLKNKILSDRDEEKLKMETEFEVQITNAHAKISSLHQEKEHLRHKIIRLNLNAKGDGENSIENMLKRISRETADLHGEFDQMGSRYDSLLGENQVLQKRLKEREKYAEFMEKEVARRTEEYVAMTRTFEDFLSSRARQSRKEREKRLPKLYAPLAIQQQSARDSLSNLLTKPIGKPVVMKSIIPAKGERVDPSLLGDDEADDNEPQKSEMARGAAYLKRFKTLSRAFASGDFRIIPTGHYEGQAPSGPALWQKTSLYGKLDDANLAIARLYKEPRASALPFIYKSENSAPETGVGVEIRDLEVKVYENKQGNVAPASAPHTLPPERQVQPPHRLMVGGKAAFPQSHQSQ